MRALTVHQPWAGAISHHGKDVENRTWAPRSALGEYLLIHAGALRVRDVDVTGPEFEVRGAVVAVAQLAGAHIEQGDCCGPWGEQGVYHWQLTHMVRLDCPVPAKGRQRLWRPAPEVITAVRAQITEMG